MIISIDGGAATGKTAVAKLLSKKIGFIHLNSGLIYRAVTYILLEKKYLNKKNSFYSVYLNKINFKIKGKNLNVILHNEKNISDFLHSKEIADNIKYVSNNVVIRKFITTIQRNLSKNKNVVCEGRDIGSVVFPYAEKKYFLQCNIKERVERRLEQYLQNNIKVTKNNLKKMILDRDYNDINRKVSPLKKVNDSIVVDTTSFTINEVVQIITNNIKDKYAK